MPIRTAALLAGSPFAGLYVEDGISTSRDEYGIWTYWPAASYELQFPGRPPLAWTAGEDPALSAHILIACRADGRALGHHGPAPVHATLLLPLHPAEPDVPRVLHPQFWFLLLTQRETASTPASARFGHGPAFATELVRERVNWSFPRPSPQLRLAPRAALRALSSGDGTSLTAEGADLRLELRFEPAPPLADAARLMARHCAQPPSPPPN